MLDAEIDRFRIGLTRFKLREIQNVVEHGEQVMRGFLGDLGDIPLLLVKRSDGAADFAETRVVGL